MLRSLADKAILCFDANEFHGSQGHPLGSSQTSLQHRKVNFHQTCEKLDQIVRQIDSSKEGEYQIAAQQLVVHKCKQGSSEISRWASQQLIGKLGFFRRAAELAGLDIRDEKNDFCAFSDCVLVEIAKRSLDSQVSVYAGDTMKARLDSEAKELSAAIKTESFNFILTTLKGIVARAESISRLERQPEPPKSARTWGGARGVEIALPNAVLGIDDPVQLHLTFEALEINKPCRFVLTIEPPLPCSPGIARRVALSDYSQKYATGGHDLRAILRHIYPAEGFSKVISLSTPFTGESVALYSLIMGENAKHESSDLDGRSPLMGRFEGFDCAQLENDVPVFVRNHFRFNRALSSCFKEYSSNGEGILIQAAGKRMVFSASIGVYERGLRISVKGEVETDIDLNVEDFTLENISVPTFAADSPILSEIKSAASEVLKRTLSVPSAVHASVFLLKDELDTRIKRQRQL